MNEIDRLVQTIGYLSEHGGKSTTIELAEHFKVTDREIRNDLRKLKRYHDIHLQRGNNGGVFLLKERWRLNGD